MTQDPIDAFRSEFTMTKGLIFLNAMLIASPPRTVAQAIKTHRAGFDADPMGYFFTRLSTGLTHATHFSARVAESAAAFFGVNLGGRPATDLVAQNTCTTDGVALFANGLKCMPGDEVVTTSHDFFSMREAWQLRARKDGVSYKEIRLFRDPQDAGLKSEIIDSVHHALCSSTRALSLTWVHSNTGVKLPIGEIGQIVREWNRGPGKRRPVLFMVDGVHGFGVENVSFADLHCDFFAAGGHKWIFGPRGTGVAYGTDEAWGKIEPTIPSFLPMTGAGAVNSPGGVRTYEHAWALADAFDLHLKYGRESVERHSHRLATRLKEGLASLQRVNVITPMSQDLSAAIVCCDLRGPAGEAVKLLREKYAVVASTSSPDANGGSHLRFSPSVLNTVDEIDATIEAVKRIM